MFAEIVARDALSSVSAAEGSSGHGNERGMGGCCVPFNGSPGCNDVSCQQAVCLEDSFCCDQDWDAVCADLAGEHCGGHCVAGPWDCCMARKEPGCGETSCRDSVCARDGACCSVAWDSRCVELAKESCGTVCELAGDCAADFKLDLDDLFGFLQCVGGGKVLVSDPYCECADMDGDHDVDTSDFAYLQRRLGE